MDHKKSFNWVSREVKLLTHFTRTDFGISMVDMARLKQDNTETTEQFIMRFKGQE
jgi:hypothetical protein